MRDFLTICIPTRNRPDYLGALLQRLKSEVEEFGAQVVVFDSSTDECTEAMVQALVPEMKGVAYVRNKTATGLDENMMSVAVLAQTEYSIWLGDDDVLVPGAMAAITESLLLRKPEFMLLNAYHASEDLSVIKGSIAPLGDDVVYADPRDFFRAHWAHMPYGTLVVKTSFVRAAMDGARRYIGTSHAYSGVVLDYLSDIFSRAGKCNIVVVRTPRVLLRESEKTWSATAATILLREIPMWFELLPVSYFPDAAEIKKEYLRDQFSFRSLLLMRLKGWLSSASAPLFDGACARSRLYFFLLIAVPVDFLRFMKRVHVSLCGGLK